MATKRGYVPIYLCVALMIVTFVYALCSTVYLSNKISTIETKAESDEVKAINKQTLAMQDLTKTLKEFIQVMK